MYFPVLGFLVPCHCSSQFLQREKTVHRQPAGNEICPQSLLQPCRGHTGCFGKPCRKDNPDSHGLAMRKFCCHVALASFRLCQPPGFRFHQPPFIPFNRMGKCMSEIQLAPFTSFKLVGRHDTGLDRRRGCNHGGKFRFPGIDEIPITDSIHFRQESYCTVIPSAVRYDECLEHFSRTGQKCPVIKRRQDLRAKPGELRLADHADHVLV